MSVRLIVREATQEDIREAVEWYDRQAPGLGAEFVRCVDACLSLISRHSRRWQRRTEPRGHRIGSPVVVIEIGGNDLLGSTTSAQFAHDLDALLARLAAPVRQVMMFELPLPPFCHEYGRVQRSVAVRGCQVRSPAHAGGGHPPHSMEKREWRSRQEHGMVHP